MGIMAHTFATLDGVIEAPPAEAYQPYMDEETMQATLSLVTESDAQLLGRDTYQHLAGPGGSRVARSPIA
jgi:hypothetical protein